MGSPNPLVELRMMGFARAKIGAVRLEMVRGTYEDDHF